MFLKRMFLHLSSSLLSVAAFISAPAFAAVYPLTPDTDVVGDVSLTITKFEDSFITLAEKYDVGFEELVQANPGIDPWVPGDGATVVIPTRHILPPRAERKGIVINLSEMRLYYFPKDGKNVYTYPLGIGRERWITPLGKLTIIAKKEKPTWYVPASIQQEQKDEGLPVRTAVPPGPDNPLGEYSMRLSNHSYLIHGTNKPAGIGRRVSHGCINMYPADVEQLYAMVPNGTPVNIVHHPFKMGWKDGYLWLEAHQPLHDYQHRGDYSLDGLKTLTSSTTRDKDVDINWTLIKQYHEHTLGVPMPVGQLRKDSAHYAALF